MDSDTVDSHNYHNGSSSDVLVVILIENKSFGDIVTVRLDVIKFSASNEKMFDSERFIVGYTKRRLIISK